MRRSRARRRIFVRTSVTLTAVLSAAVGGAGAVPIPDNTWVQVQPTVVLPENHTGVYADRSWTMAAYDSVGQQIIVWERYIDQNLPCPRPGSIYSNSLWGFDAAAETLTLIKLSNWHQEPGDPTPVPCPENADDPTPVNRHPSFTYVSSLNALHAWGGLNIRHLSGHPEDSWRFDFSTNRWTELLPLLHPANIDAVWPATTYDPSTRQVVIVDAPDDTPPTTRYTWLFDIDTGEYEQLDVTPGPLIGGGGGNALTHDSTRQLVWLFGAGPSVFSSGGDELWRLDTASRTWEQIGYSAPWPANRIYQGLTYIPKHDVLLLYGGDPRTGTFLTDTWIYWPGDDVWTELSVPGASSSKFIELAYDEQNDVVVAQVAQGEWWLFRYVPPACSDNDGDGHQGTFTCRPAGNDCDDNDPAIHPAALEICDGIDNNCDGQVDEGFDGDADGYTSCDAPVADCDDADPSINPQARETCGNGVDENCNGMADDVCVCTDGDGDGFGPAGENNGCLNPFEDDCNDSDGSIHPGASEVCGDGIDQDCSGADLECPIQDVTVEAETMGLTAYRAMSGNYASGGEFITLFGSGQPSGLATVPFPGQTALFDVTVQYFDEVDGQANVEVRVAGQFVDGWFFDQDIAGNRPGANNIAQRTVATGLYVKAGDAIDVEGTANRGEYANIDYIKFVFAAEACFDNDVDGHDGVADCTTGDDCNDSDPDIYPGAPEICDGVDDDCDGQVDDGYDTDGDGYTICATPAPDCDDVDAGINPGAREVCGNGIDENCDGIDPECICTDNDQDGYGIPGNNSDCPKAGDDCADDNAGIHPGATELCDGVDNDCDVGTPDGSGELPPDNSNQQGVCAGSKQSCIGGAWQDDYSGIADHESVETTCDGLDNDCNGETDAGLTTTFYADGDADGFGNAGVSQDSCQQPTGYVADNTDCDDTDPDVHPGAAETCGDGIDQDCSGADLECPAGDVLIEAESMTLTEYRVMNGNYASGGQLITLFRASLPSGTATTSFPGGSGLYDVIVQYFDEVDGQAHAEVRIAGQMIDAWNFDQELGGNRPGAQNVAQRTVASGLQINAGDAIEIVGTVDGREYANIDYIRFSVAGQ